MIYIELAIILLLPVALSVFSAFVEMARSHQTCPGALLQGTLFGGIAIAAMWRPMALHPDLILDASSIPGSLCALFFGPLAAAATGIIGVAFRLGSGESGGLTGTLIFLSSVGIGLLARFHFRQAFHPPSPSRLIVFGLAVHGVMLLLLIALPGGMDRFLTLRAALPALCLYSLATLLSGKILADMVAPGTPAAEMGAAASETPVNDKAPSGSPFLAPLLDAIPVPIFYKDIEGRYQGFNKAFAAFLGANQEQLLGKSVFDLHPPALAKTYYDRDIELLTSSGAQQYESQIKNFRGELRDVITNKAAFTDNEGNTTGLIGTIMDITERKRAEEVHLSHLRFFEIMDQVNRAMQKSHDLEETMGEVLETMLSIFNCDRAWLCYPCDPQAPHWKVPMERTRPEYPGAMEMGIEVPMDPDVANVFRTMLAADGPVTFGPGCDQPLVGDVPERFQEKSQIALTVYPKGDKPWLIGMHQCSNPRVWTPEEKTLFQEIGRRLGDTLTSQLIYRDLENSEAKTRSILDNIGIGVALISPEMEVLEMNRRMHEWFPDVDTGTRPICYKAFHAPTQDTIGDDCPTRKTLQDGCVHQTTREIPLGGVLRELRIMSSPILDGGNKVTAAVEIVEDITENRSLECQLQHAQKMESVGRLAGGVAHDFNNMLAVIMGRADLALDQLTPGHPLHTNLMEIRKATKHSADLTRQLLAFARKQTVAPQRLNLNETVTGMLRMLRRLIGEDIELTWLPGKGVWPVKMDPSQIDQILANLCVNARDAIPGVGKVTIETQAISFDDAYCKVHPEFSPGDFVMLAISDDGHGMEKKTVEKIFEPFFTTKETGKGTGLGLATVYGIVKQNDGFINVYSEPNLGTTFKIYLPRHASGARPEKPENRPSAVPRGRETLLLVEDEKAILDMAKLMLEDLGYHVLTASSPAKAIRMAETHTGAIHLLMTDVVMPQMNGRDLAYRLNALFPELKCLFMSGYPDAIIAHQGALEEGIDYIQKPFSMANLAAKVRGSLDNR